MPPNADERTQNLTEKQLRTILIVLESKNISEGVQRAKVSRETFYSWMRNPVFKEEFIRQRKETVELALSALKTSAGEAVEVLRNLLRARHESVRLRTALGMLDHICKFIQVEDLDRRITELERRSENER